MTVHKPHVPRGENEERNLTVFFANITLQLLHCIVSTSDVFERRESNHVIDRNEVLNTMLHFRRYLNDASRITWLEETKFK